ncbi:organic cation/carnitine transporter 3-like [Nicotiana sylvestris]|uniref:Organic cation/carnitine transporter 3-like n=2 Tax=Nicotiana TaxID=4085 RepID=A0A1S4AAM7_TOBAC|nr:PREDICTED: organic cation/carnitine transporter 3-like [Nicotiana sylvestris]XP_016473700.1 PREDICTED: organic cation/carnitine transporter 3-like [Nicotiana tabacum]
MADSTPLLSHSPPKLNDISSPEEIIEPFFGSCGIEWPQILQVILVSLACFFEAQQTFITIFTDAIPTWHCTQLNNTNCNSMSNICQLSTNEWNWDKPIYTSIVSEWSLHCSDNPILQGLPASSFFMGCLLGGLVLGLLGDTIGRKTMLFFGCLIMSMASIFIAFSNNIWMYSALRFLSGYGRAAIGSSVLVLSSESVAKQYQGQVGTVGFLMSTLGFVSLPGLAYFSRNYSWRVLYLWTSLPTIIYCMLLQFCVYESPKWLLSKGKNREAFAVLTTFVAPHFKNLSLNDHKVKIDNGFNQPLIKILLKKRWILGQLLLALTTGFGIGLMYYGMPLGLGNFSLNLYLSTGLNAMLELPAFLIVFFLVEKCKRRSTLVGLSILSGVCGMLCMIVDKWKVLQLVLELISFFSACTAFDLFLIYTSELFPTSIRNATVSIVWQAVVLGGVVSPVLVDAGGDRSKILPYLVLGIMTSIAGSLVIFLPETKGLDLCKNMEEKEQEGNGASYVMNGV